MKRKPIRERAVCLLMALLATQPLIAAEVKLDVLFYDPKGFLGGQRAALEAEVDRILGAAGVSVRWLPVDRSFERKSGPLPLRATLVETQAEALRLSKGVMGVTSGEGGGNVFIFYPTILRTLRGGSAAPLGPPKLERRLRARAIARVLVHELVHFLCPGRPHADAGLMKASWTRRLLVEPGVVLDAASQSAVLEGLAARVGSPGGQPMR